MWHGQVQRQRIAGVTASVSTVPIAVIAAVRGMVSRQHQWDHSRRMPGACTICTGTCGSGFKTVGMTAIRAHLLMGLRGSLRVAGAWCVVVIGPTGWDSCALRIATGSPRTPPVTGSTISVFELPGLFNSTM